MQLIGREPALDVLRPSPRFQSLLRKIGPPEAIRSWRLREQPFSYDDLV